MKQKSGKSNLMPAEHIAVFGAPDEEKLFEMAELFKVFADSTRIRVLYAMFEQEMNVSQICEKVEMSISAVSHQLRLLKQSRLVKCRREGRKAYYMLADDHVKTIIGMAKEHIEED
ncbi:MAG: winged helix-turn-helix transcriptional regulator [Oscillospiraceae bacterium]|nr:winged helix-turn-helix transcriptional regulator [Oscillospiraceae bacterium]